MRTAAVTRRRAVLVVVKTGEVRDGPTSGSRCGSGSHGRGWVGSVRSAGRSVVGSYSGARGAVRQRKGQWGGVGGGGRLCYLRGRHDQGRGRELLLEIASAIHSVRAAMLERLPG